MGKISDSDMEERMKRGRGRTERVTEERLAPSLMMQLKERAKFLAAFHNLD